ncbi:hypothetical protein [Bradyrhizobium genosp. P]|uniref:hypothetical protein n=1 Tax=Bradyrhizobium genosp. P TaxID=83641 RepID=UPI003CF02C65
MPNPQFFFAQPQFRASASDLTLALASDYYRFEVFATAEDRDACCGPTAHPDVRYVRATMQDVVQSDIRLDDIGCGVPLGHPHFELIMAPLFDATMEKLFRDMPKRLKSGTLASTEMLIARTRYTIAAECDGEWVFFPVEAMTAFEDADSSVTDRTVQWLHDRLVLTTSPSPPGARPS